MNDDHVAASDDGWDELDVRLGWDAPPLVPPGDHYQATPAGAKIRESYGGEPRLHMAFTIRGGPYDGKTVPFICTLPRRSRGRWVSGVPPSSRFFRAWCVANGGPPRRHDRMGLHVFKRHLFRIRVRLVTTDRARQPLPEAVRYSVVDALLEKIA